jgi:hypothetical protein
LKGEFGERFEVVGLTFWFKVKEVLVLFRIFTFDVRKENSIDKKPDVSGKHLTTSTYDIQHRYFSNLLHPYTYAMHFTFPNTVVDLRRE